MKQLLLIAVVAMAGVAEARPPRGGFHPARPAQPMWPAPRPPRVVVRPPPVIVRPPRVVVRPAPRVVYQQPRYRPMVRMLPMGFVALSVGAAAYYYADGAFYAPVSGGYQVVTPPIGAAVSVLPYGAQQQVINGETYAWADGAWYWWDGWRAAWIVVNPPY